MTAPGIPSIFEPAQLDHLSTGTVLGYEALHEWGAIALASELDAAPRILDLGCGTGTGILALGRVVAGATIVGCDPSLDMLAVAKERCASLGDRVSWVHGDLESLRGVPLFDAIVCTHVFQVIPPADKKAFLSAIRTLLRAEGLLLLTQPGRSSEPAGQALMARIRAEYALRNGVSQAVLVARHEQIKHSLHPVTEAELQSLLLECGYREPTPLFRVLNVNAWIARGHPG